MMKCRQVHQRQAVIASFANLRERIFVIKVIHDGIRTGKVLCRNYATFFILRI